MLLSRHCTAIMLLFLGAILSGCGTLSGPSGGEIQYPLLNCGEAREEYDDHMVACVTARSQRLSFARDEALGRGRAQLAAQFQSSTRQFIRQNAREIADEVGGDSTSAVRDTLISEFANGTGASLSGSKVLEENLYEESGQYRVNRVVGIPKGKAGTEWSRQMEAMPAVGITRDERRKIAKLWLRWTLARDMSASDSSLVAPGW